MRAFGWKKWSSLFGKFKKSDWTSLERWGLAYLHSNYALDELAKATAASFRQARKPAAISVQSVWIDGTPQVTATATSKLALKGELADLLIILNETNLNGTTVRRTGLLLQGKVSKRHNRLPSNPTTKRERQLLENLDRSQPMTVFRDMAANTEPIGTYTFGSGAGLKDCARYLIMPKGSEWYLYFMGPAPFQVGWPPNLKNSELRNLNGIVEAIQRAAVLGVIGRQIQDKTPTLSCEWSKLVWDLLGDYQPVTMSGYGHQPRVNSSESILAFSTSHGESYSGQLPPISPTIEHPPILELRTPPAISILQVNVRMPDTDDHGN